MNNLPLPHGHGSFRPSFSSRSLSPCTTRIPHLTLVSDGKPRRRLLIGLKKGIFEVVVSHDGAPSRQNDIWNRKMTRRAVKRRRVSTKSFERSVSSDISLLFDVIRAGSSNFRADEWIRTSMDLPNQDKPSQDRSLSQSSHIGKQAISCKVKGASRSGMVRLKYKTPQQQRLKGLWFKASS